MVASSLIAASLFAPPFEGEVLLVVPAGGEAGSGGRRFTSIEKALESASPGDRVQLAPGRYLLDKPLRITKSGSPGKWIEIAGPLQGEAILDGTPWRPASIGEAHSQGLVEISGQSYLRLKRLTLIESPGFGVHVHDKSSHIDIQDCRVDHTFAPGIGAWNSSDIRIVGCEVVRANSQTKRLYGSRSGECPHEAISIAGVNRFEAGWNHVHHCQKEGIDLKEVSQNGVVHHNYVHNLDRQGLYVDAWFGTLQNVQFLSNVVQDCEWGFVASCEGRGSKLIGVTVRNNLLYRNRASGIYFGTWGNNGPRSEIVIEHNTLWSNGSRLHWAGPTGNIDLRASNTRQTLVRKNLLLGGGAYEIATFAASGDELREKEVTITDNHFATDSLPSLEGLEMGPYGTPHPTLGESPRFGEVTLEGPEFGSFLPAVESPSKPMGYGALWPESLASAAFVSPLEGFEPYLPRTDGLHPVLAAAARHQIQEP